MKLVLVSSSGSYAQFVAVLVVFVLVLGITALTTKWIAGYQKQQTAGSNIEVVETSRIANNKFVQIVRVGEKYIAIAVCKETVTLLGEVPSEQLKMRSLSKKKDFRTLLENAVNRKSDEKIQESQPHDEQRTEI